VILADASGLLSPKLAEALARFHKVPMADMGASARHSWGILAEKLAKDRADALLAETVKAGLAALVLPQNLLEDPPPAKVLKTLGLEPERVRLVEAGGTELAVEWSAAWKDVSLAAAAAFKQTTSKTLKVTEGPTSAEKAVNMGLMLSGIPISVGKNKERLKTVEETELALYLDLAVGEARYRVDAQHFDYSFLKARMAFGAFANFRATILELSDRAPGAIKNKGFSALLDGKPLGQLGYESLADLDRESRWLLTLRALKRA
jgi:hypothetical protein